MMLLYWGEITMEDGFSGRHSKGLFTFYREQGEQEAKIGQMKSQLVKLTEVNRHYASAVAVNVKYEKNKERVSLLMNHQTCNKPSRYKQEESSDKHQIYTSKHVFSLNFNSPRKNGYYMQIIAQRNKRAKSELDESTNKPIAIKINRRCVVGQLSVRQMPSSIVKELFQPKKETSLKAHTSRRKKKLDEEVNEASRQNREDNMFHIPLQRFRRYKGKCQIKSSVFKDPMEFRRQKIDSNAFWQEVKERKSKRQGNISNINRRIEEWITINDLAKIKKDHLPRISPEPAE